MWPLTVAILLLAAGAASGGERTEADMKTVIGPRNPELASGAEALLAGRIEDGIRLTHIGLGKAHGTRERQAAYSNLCAGYVMLKQYETAIEMSGTKNTTSGKIEAFGLSLAKADLDRGEAIAPKSSKIKEVRGWLRDHTEPVEPTITIDDRREDQAAEEDEEGNGDENA